MRIALLSPYSWTYPGGVTRHVKALAQSFMAEGHYVRVLAPWDPPGRASALLHSGARPPVVPAPDFLIPLGRTVGIPANGSVSNVSLTPFGLSTALTELRSGRYDVVHIHEAMSPLAPWVATDMIPLPKVGTFHTFNENPITNRLASLIGARRMLNRLHVRIAVSEASAWTAQRYLGGHYRIIPNGVWVDSERAQRAGRRPMGERLKILFVGQAVERKGLPVLLRAFEALREHIPCELTVIGPSTDELKPLLLDPTGVRMLGKLSDEDKWDELEAADVVCVPSLHGESFGLVLTEAFANGTPVVASDIVGYRDVVQNGVDGILVPPGDAQALAETLRELYHQPEVRTEMALAAARNVERFAWPHVAQEVLGAYEDAIATPEAEGWAQRAAVKLGVRSADLKPHAPARRMASLQPRTTADRRARALALARRGGLAAVSLLGIVLAFLALQKIGIGHVAAALVGSSPSFVVLGLVIMCSAMAVRAISWHAILEAALEKSVRLSDAMQGTFIGILMSSTLPARLGEPARAMVVARRTGKPRENLPVVLGTLVSQTFLNIVALVILAVVMFSSVDIFQGHETALLAVAITPFVLLLVIAVLPTLLRHHATQRFVRVQAVARQAYTALSRVRDGLKVFRQPRLGAIATVAQLAAWGLQCLSCYTLLVALGLSHQVGFAGAAAVLFAVNITAVLPATPANLGVFQAACATVLHEGWHVGFGTGVAYGVILQAVELTGALLMGMPALLKEGMSWREIRTRAMHATPVKLPERRTESLAHLGRAAQRPNRAPSRSGSAVRAEG
ncbi:MAG: flippase-like domain-containing protein [Solirubrobacterales bacterium]|nr:flippase-like domain-containing protein [Solirubrobacterales bacterium]